MDKAVQDLVWLSERLSGIIAVKDELKDLTSIMNQKKELENSVSEYKLEIEKLLKEKEEISLYSKSVIADAESYQKEILNKSKEVEAEAKATATEILKEAADQVSISNQKATEALEAVSKSIEEKKTELKIVAADVDANRTKLESYKQQIANLKEKL